jgi:signal transduction histidine kinase
VTNLISNAIKFSPRGEEVVATVEKGADVVRIAVRDHGAGIPKEFRARVFEKFSQAEMSNVRAKGGTGLGLSIARQIVHRMGGEIGFVDAPGGGTNFFVELPRLQSEAGPTASKNGSDARPRPHMPEDVDLRVSSSERRARASDGR